MTSSIYMLATGIINQKLVTYSLKTYYNQGFRGKLICVCHSWDASEISKYAQPHVIPKNENVAYVSQIGQARRTKLDPWVFGNTYSTDYILCCEYDVLLHSPWSEIESYLDGLIYVEKRKSGDGSLYGEDTVGAGIVAIPNNDFGRAWSSEASSLGGRTDTAAAVAACHSIGAQYCRSANFAGTNDLGIFPLTHYPRKEGKIIMSQLSTNI